MKTSFLKSAFFCIALAVCFSSILSAQTKMSAVNADSAQTINDKRKIIKLLFSDIFRSNVKDQIYLSTSSIPLEIQRDFPEFDNLLIEFINSPADSKENCPFTFYRFIITGKKATVSFGNCHSGLGYSFVKNKGKWQFAPSDIKNKN